MLASPLSQHNSRARFRLQSLQGIEHHKKSCSKQSCLMMLKFGIFFAVATCAAGVWGPCDKPCGTGQRTDPNIGLSINCHTFSCDSPLTCPCTGTDLVFLVDNSGSIGANNFWVEKQFIIDVVQGLATHAKAAAIRSRIGIVGFGNAGYVEFDMNAGYNLASIDTLVDKTWQMAYLAQWTNTASGLEKATEMFDTQSQGNNQQVLVVLTDGASNKDKALTIPNAQILHTKGVGVFGIGIGPVNDAEMTAISSTPTIEFYHYVTDYGAVSSITDKVMDGTCCKVKPPACTITGETACSQTCGGGEITVTESCDHFNFNGDVTKTVENLSKKSCPDVPCPPECLYGGVTHSAGDVWIDEYSPGLFKEYTCPQSLPAGVTDWLSNDYSTGICYDDGKEYRAGETWKVDNATHVKDCSCADSGESICVTTDKNTNVLFCKHKRVEHDPETDWVIDLGGGRMRLCACPKTLPATEKWRARKFCYVYCDVAGTKYMSGDTWQKTDQGVLYDCRCNKFGTTRCKTNRDTMCQYAQVWHDRGEVWLQDVSAGRKKECTCPTSGTFSKLNDCVDVCYVSGSIYQIGDKFQQVDPNTGTQTDCICSQNGNVRCDNVAVEDFPGCVARGTTYPPGQKFVLDVSNGRQKECDCPDKMDPGTSWSVAQYCIAICVDGSTTYHAGDTWDKTDGSGATLSCTCKSFGKAACK